MTGKAAGSKRRGLIVALGVAAAGCDAHQLYAFDGRSLAQSLAVLDQVGLQLDGNAWRLALFTAFSMGAALALMLPVAWVYRRTKSAGDYDRSVIETLIILPVAVAAVVRMVQNSLPLAFALTGIVAAVRFRNTLKDTKDTVYVFLAIGIGLAAGAQAMTIAAVMSLVFSIIAFTLGRVNMTHQPAVFAGGPATLAFLPSTGGPRLAERSAAATATLSPQRTPRKKGPTAVLVVRPAPLRPAWRSVEQALRDHAKRWKLLELQHTAEGDEILAYKIRLKRKASPAELLEDVRRRGGRDVLGAELRLTADDNERQAVA